MKGRYFVMIGIVLLLLTISVGNNTPVDVTLEQVPELSTLTELTPHGQLFITDETGLQAWPGAGTAQEPYVISGINITLDDQCLSISNTNSHFVVRDSYFHYTGSLAIPAVWLFNANNSRIENCTVISSGTCFMHEYSYNSNVTGNRLFGGMSTNSPHIRITHNVLILEDTNADGIRIRFMADHAIIFNNSIDGHQGSPSANGIFIQQVVNATIAENILTDCPLGIRYVEVFGGIATANVIVGSNTGIRAYDTPLLRLEDNVIKDGTGSILILGDNCTVTGNSVFRNSGSGISVDGHNSTLYGNFIGFNQDEWQAVEVIAANFWDDGISIGNYWSDYDGEGTYTVSGNQGGVDHYPKMFTESVITHPANLVVEIGTTETISWSSNGTLPESFVLTIDGEIEESDSWDGSILTFDLDDLVAGVHEFELTTHFGSRMSVSDSVTVTVESASGPSIVLAQVSGLAGESVEVSAEVSDISGILEVVLSYSVDSYTWTNVTMSESGAQWNGTIPDQAADTIVGYKIFAWDGLGNLAVSDTKSYTTQMDPASPPTTLYLIGGAGVAGVVVVGLVVMKRR